MHVVIMGCGRVGSALAHSLEDLGHDVAIVDQQAHAFRRLRPDFHGRKVHGVGFDRDTLEEAGTRDAGGFAAVSSGDNSNIIAARVARETFGVETVVARIYDPRRAEIYQRLGIPTVATVRWTADQMLQLLLPEGARSQWRDPSGTVQLSQIHVDPSWIGHKIGELEEAAGCRVVVITRYGEGMVPDAGTMLQEGDLVHVAVRNDDVEHATATLRSAPEGGE